MRELPGVNNVVSALESIQYNALASIFTGSQDYAQTATNFISTFFINQDTGMKPRVRYGQLIRGPDQADGQYIGFIDLRGIVKLVNAVQLLRTSEAPAWTSDQDSTMKNWAEQYVEWMHTDTLGQKALAAPK